MIATPSPKLWPQGCRRQLFPPCWRSLRSRGLRALDAACTAPLRSFLAARHRFGRGAKPDVVPIMDCRGAHRLAGMPRTYATNTTVDRAGLRQFLTPRPHAGIVG